MRLACRMTNGDGIGFDYATVELTPDYVVYLLRLVAEAKRLKESDDTFCEIEYLDFAAEYGASLGGLETNLPESDTSSPWVEVPEDFQWPADSQQSIAASTVVVTGKTIVWRALGAHDFGGPYFETEELQVEQLRRLFPQEATEDPNTQYIDAGGGFCPKCRSEQVEGDLVDFDGPHCSQRMRCLQCDAVWFDVYTLSSIEPQDD